MNYEIELFCNGLLCLGALIGFIYSLVKFFRPKKAMYKKWWAARWAVCSLNACTRSFSM